jgi:glycosyltransferase involved in cell wall biosynthesis
LIYGKEFIDSMLRNTSKKIILVSYFFSSKYETGGIRAQKFAKYLPEFGFEPIIITKRRTDNYIYNGRCIFLRTLSVNWPFHLEALTWLPGLFLTCLKIIRNEKVEVLLFSCGPFSSAVVGLLLKKLFNLKLVLDYRDYWTLSPYVPKIPKFNRILNSLQKPLEKMLLKSADRLITIQKTMEEKYENIFPFLKGKVDTIFNGFDASDFSGFEHGLFEKFTILHLGNIHLDLNPSYPLMFLQCLKKMKDEGMIHESSFQVLLIGEPFEFLDRKVQVLGLSEIVRNIGRLPHGEAIVFLKKSHLLLLIVETEGIMTSKVFEYLATGKPILALIKEGEIRDLIEKYSKNAYILTDPDISRIVMAVVDCYKNYLGRSFESNESFMSTFNRKYRTMQLAMYLEEVKR